MDAPIHKNKSISLRWIMTQLPIVVGGLFLPCFGSFQTFKVHFLLLALNKTFEVLKTQPIQDCSPEWPDCLAMRLGLLKSIFELANLFCEFYKTTPLLLFLGQCGIIWTWLVLSKKFQCRQICILIKFIKVKILDEKSETLDNFTQKLAEI